MSNNNWSPAHLIDSDVQERTSLRDIFFLKSPFFWMFRLLAAKFSKSVSVPAERVEWMEADTESVEPGEVEVDTDPTSPPLCYSSISLGQTPLLARSLEAR